ncbi:HYR domain-containing protein [Winogradskyella sp.]|uniref:HYR domain-containing protein n=1 Tax=Winogradskyella sp. TaxID=1883156 RepID=UPI003BA84CC8
MKRILLSYVISVRRIKTLILSQINVQLALKGLGKIVPLRLLFILCFFIGLSSQAQQTTWYLDNVTFDSGATAKGSFNFDATTSSYSNININLTNSPNYGTLSFTTAASVSTSSGVQFFTQVASNQTGLPTLILEFSQSLAIGSGNVDITPGIISFLGTCNNGDCQIRQAPFEDIVTGRVTTNPPPMAVCRDFSGALDITGNLSISPIDIDNGSSDDTAGFILSLDRTNFTCANIGPNTVTLTVTDSNGSIDRCTATCTVIGTDIENPTISCPSDITVNNDAGLCGALVTVPLPTIADNCSVAFLTNNFNNFSDASGTYPVGTTSVVWTVTDTSGNQNSCTQLITVVDNEAPSITCPILNPVVNSDPGSFGAFMTILPPSLTDNCGGGIIPDTSRTTFNFSGFRLSDTPAIMRNAIASAADVTLELTFGGQFIGANDDFILQGPDGNTLFSDNNFSSGCSTITRSITVPQATWNAWITTHGSNLPFKLLRDLDIFQFSCSLDVSDFFRIRAISLGKLTVSNDYNNKASISDILPVGTTDIVWTVTDESGNSNTCTQSITVNDTEAPAFSCPSNFNLYNVPGLCNSVLNYTPTVADNFSFFTNSLESVLRKFNLYNKSITSLIPNPHHIEMDGQEGVNAEVITDGDYDMYDNGNIISTNLHPSGIKYSDNTIVKSTAFGTNGAFFTRKVENMWLLAADLDGINDFNITGNLGAFGPNNGIVDGLTPTITVAGVNYNLFVKRVYNTNAVPSVYHLIIIPENNAASHNFAMETEDDQHQVTGLSGTNRLYYLLFAGREGTFIDNTTITNMAIAFITNITTVAGTLVQTDGLPSGSTFPVGTTTNTFIATDGSGNQSTCSYTVTVSDRGPLTLSCPSDISLIGPQIVSYTTPTISEGCGFPAVPTSVPGFIPFGTFGDSTYFISDDHLTAPQAFAMAQANNYDLLTINSAEENSYIASRLAQIDDGAIIGYNDVATEGTFVWQSGQPAFYENWATNQPSNTGDSMDYAVMQINGSWVNVSNITATEWMIIEFHDYSTGRPIQVTGLPSGSLFTANNTVNTFYGKDLSGSINTCSFTVTINNPILLSPKAYLEGAAQSSTIATDGLMRDDLRTSGLIPLQTPYTDTSSINSSVLGITGPDAIVDWVFIELRDATANTTIIESQSALLQRDGDIVGLDGTSPLSFNAAPGNYHVAVKHRNHIGIITASPQTLGTIATLVDLSSDPAAVEGNTNSLVLLPGGAYGMYTGDYDDNAQVQNTDANAVVQLIGGSGYDAADMDINTQIQNTDVNALINPNIGRGEQFNRGGSSELLSNNVTLAFANAQITNDGIDNFYEADIVISSTTDFYVGSGQVYFDYSTTAFGENISTNGNIEYSQPDGSILGHSFGAFSPAYKDFVQNDNTTSRVSLSFQQNIALVGLETAPQIQVSSTPKVLFHIKIRYTNVSEDANMCFYSDGVFQDQFFTACGGTGIADCTNAPGTQITDDTYDCSEAGVGTLGIGTNQEALITLYPNPADTSFSIHGLRTSYSVKVYDIQGRLIVQEERDDSSPIDMHDYDEGVYLVVLSNARGSVTKRLIKKSN